MELTQKELKEILHYDPETGWFTWLVSKPGPGGGVGARAGWVNRSTGRRGVGINGSVYSEAKLVFLYMTGSFSKYEVRHKNKIKDDNRWGNLYERIPANNSGVKGVYWAKSHKKWQVKVQVSGKQARIGGYTKLEDAIAAQTKVINELNKWRIK
jgi:hypothetical protein